MFLFSADLHLGHANIIKHCERPFSWVISDDTKKPTHTGNLKPGRKPRKIVTA